MRRNIAQSPSDSKPELRRELCLRRNNLSIRTRTNLDCAIQQQVLQLAIEQKAQSVACYWPFNGEPDIIPVCRQLMANDCELALPVVSGKDDHLMSFYSWRQNTNLIKNRYGICEPEKSTLQPVSGFDMLIMPLVGYDRFGNRLGMGAGYYDRHLELLRHSDIPLRVGIAYSLQKIDPIEKNSWDIPLHGVVNEHGWFTFGGSLALES